MRAGGKGDFQQGFGGRPDQFQQQGFGGRPDQFQQGKGGFQQGFNKGGFQQGGPGGYARWATANAVLLLRDHPEAFEALCDALRARASVGECVGALEAAFASPQPREAYAL